MARRKDRSHGPLIYNYSLLSFHFRFVSGQLADHKLLFSHFRFPMSFFYLSACTILLFTTFVRIGTTCWRLSTTVVSDSPQMKNKAILVPKHYGR